MSNNICYHTRITGDVKVRGGSFGGDFSIDTVNRMLRNHKYTAIVKPSGSPVFVDDFGREVSLYFHVDPRQTTLGIEALAAHRLEVNKRIAQDEAKERKVNELIANMSTDELLERLS